MPDYLKLPLRFGPFFEKKSLASCTLLDSVYRNLHLIITTAPGENKTDPGYGSVFWENDYDTHMNNEVRRELIAKGIQEQISKYEKRITGVKVDVKVRLASLAQTNGSVQRKKIEIIIQGKLLRNMEAFRFQTGFYISPYTLD